MTQPLPPSGGGPAAGPRRRLPARVAVFGALLVVVLILTSSGSIRSWWAHRLHDVTGASRPADYVLGLVVGLLPVAGVVAGAIGRKKRNGIARVLRMIWFGSTGFVVTYLLSPSPAQFLSHHATVEVFDQQAPGYLAGVFTGVLLWLAALVVAAIRARTWWRRFTSPRPPQPPDGQRIIDV